MFSNLKQNWVVFIAAFASAALQLSFIAKSSIWHDEAYSLWLTKYGFGQIIARTARDVHPPLYYLVLRAWTNLFGITEVAARSLSTAFIVGIIFFGYFLIKRLFGIGAARTTALFLAFGPFLVRYGQEARMYAMVAFLVTLATYLLVLALDKQDKKYLAFYALVTALAFYTHYYAIFIIPVQWIYIATRTQWNAKSRTKKTLDIKSIWWWVTNVAIVALFLPWLPSALGQFTRVQGGFWIPPVSVRTLPSTINSLLVYENLSNWGLLLFAPTIVISGLIISAIILNKPERKRILLITLWATLTPVTIFALSWLSRPIYVDRYFVYAAVAFYILLAILLYVKPLNSLYRIRIVLVAITLAVFAYGIQNVYQQSTHQMRQVASHSNDSFQSGDRLISGELYTYLDYNYYNNTGQPVSLYSPNGISGYGETSLFYDQPELIIRDLDTVKGSRVWVIGKIGQKDYWHAIPNSWKLVETNTGGDLELRLYQTQ